MPRHKPAKSAEKLDSCVKIEKFHSTLWVIFLRRWADFRCQLRHLFIDCERKGRLILLICQTGQAADLMIPYFQQLFSIQAFLQ
jgi:hypothetical protein